MSHIICHMMEITIIDHFKITADLDYILFTPNFITVSAITKLRDHKFLKKIDIYIHHCLPGGPVGHLIFPF